MSLIEQFHINAGKSVQRLFSKSPNACSFFGLGWIRLERMVEVKKLLFTRSILALDDSESCKMVFCKRVEDHLMNVEAGRRNIYSSNVFDMLNVASDFGFLDVLVGMSRMRHHWSKDVWKRNVWKRAWELDECYWGMQRLCHRSLDLMMNINGKSRYLVWWQISDADHRLMRCWETMVRLISHTSLLKVDDVRLKGSTVAARFCTSCDLSAMEDARHLIMQCPKWQSERTELMAEILNISDGTGQALLESQCDLLYVLMGKHARGFTYEQMVGVWTMSAWHIARMYNRKVRQGIG